MKKAAIMTQQQEYISQKMKQQMEDKMHDLQAEREQIYTEQIREMKESLQLKLFSHLAAFLDEKYNNFKESTV